jgi:GNAT superfamily N-acetyltransferase
MDASQITEPPAAAWRVRPAEPGDEDAIAQLVRELATYEREPESAVAHPDDFATALFGPDPRVHAHVAEVRSGTGRAAGDGWEVAGIAVWFVTFSTWTGRHGIWLEDLFVAPEHRRLGLGRELLATLAGVCVERGWPRLDWSVLDWNEPAHGFYRSIGARPMDEWTTWRLTGPELGELGTGAPAP